MDVYALFEENPLITTEEYIRQVKELGLPEELQECLITLGIEARKWLDNQNDSEVTARYGLTLLLPYIIEVAIKLIVCYGVYYALVKFSRIRIF